MLIYCKVIYYYSLYVIYQAVSETPPGHPPSGAVRAGSQRLPEGAGTNRIAMLVFTQGAHARFDKRDYHSFSQRGHKSHTFCYI